MWTPERLVDVSLFVSRQDIEPVTEALMHDEALHLNLQESEQWSPDPSWTERTETYRALQDRARRLATTLGATPSSDGRTTAPPPRQPRPSRDLPALQSDLLRLETRGGSWIDDLRAAERSVHDLEAARHEVELLLPVHAPVEDLRALRYHHLAVGTLPSENVERVAAALFQVSFVLLPLERSVDRTLIAVATPSEDGPVLDRALRSAFFEPIQLPRQASGRPATALATLDDLLDEARRTLERVRSEGDALRSDLGHEMIRLQAEIERNLELCEVIRHLPFRDGVYVIGGFIPKRRLDEVSAHLRDAAEGPLVIQALPPDASSHGTSVPSLVHNPRWLKPFEVLVDTYGVTGYDELNPTLIAAATFTFMFGLMFGDMGHGAILAALGAFLTYRGLSAGMVVVAGGLSSMLFGALYGVAFGAAVFDALWLQPLHSIFELLIAAVLAGVVILNLGMVLNLISAQRSGDRLRFWLDRSGVLGLLLYWTLLGGGFAVFQGLVPTPVWLAALLPLAALTMFREPLEERLRGGRPSWTGNLVGGFFELFETLIGYISNSLSFVRMGAFAVAHEGLSQMLLSSSSGGPSGWLVFLLGTLVIVGFEGLIVGIQSLRLSYYEFFGRFFQGRGTRFRPLVFAGGTDV